VDVAAVVAEVSEGVEEAVVVEAEATVPTPAGMALLLKFMKANSHPLRCACA
jgi:hypothetical protein